MRGSVVLLLLLVWGVLQAQHPVELYVSDARGLPLPGVLLIWANDSSYAAVTNADGYVLIWLPLGRQILYLTYAGNADTLQVNVSGPMLVRWQWKAISLPEVSIVERRDTLLQERLSAFRLMGWQAQRSPVPFGDFNRLLASLPGVVANNELSSSYSVRGGNFDENLVYVDEVMIYRPFLIRAGQQEGLSFVNPDLVEEVHFYTGGWDAAYGDKLSSLMLVRYKEPRSFRASLNAGILNSSAHVEGTALGSRLSYVLGLRRKSARYLLATLPVQGQYLPNFVDGQLYATYRLGKRHKLKSLLTAAQNRYRVVPTFSQVDFGTINRRLRLSVAFDGQEEMRYDMTQNNLQWESQWTDRLHTRWIASWLWTREREYSEVEGFYRLCEVGQNFGAGGFNTCVREIGLGSNFLYLRNELAARVFSLENRSEYRWQSGNQTLWGLRWANEYIDDLIDEYRFVDSAGYISIIEQLDANSRLQSQRWSFFLQQRWYINDYQLLTAGIRTSYWTYNQEWTYSPSLQWTVRRQRRTDWVWKLGLGWYNQPPFFRELRDFGGQLHPNVRAQQSLQLIAGTDLLLELLGRPFRLMAELYYKYLWRVNPYDVENVRIRYYARNDAEAYAAGIDLRLSGELIRGAESWFSLSLMRTEENLFFDEQHWLRRPTDQRLTVGAYLEDHLPNNPSWRVNLQLQWATGLPFSVPNELRYRSAFQGRPYRRVDIGFSKYLTNVRWKGQNILHSLWLRAEVLNILGINNVISYTWIQDINQQRYAVPNGLSVRFFNLRLALEY